MKSVQLLMTFLVAGFFVNCHAQMSKKPALPKSTQAQQKPAHSTPQTTRSKSAIVTHMDLENSQITERTITIKNALTDPMPAYTHWSGTYKPDIFEISIDGKKIKPGESTKAKTAPDGTIAVEYYSKFQNGRTTHKRVTLQPKDGKNNFDLQFEWHDKYRIKMNDATPQSVTVVQ